MDAIDDGLKRKSRVPAKTVPSFIFDDNRPDRYMAKITLTAKFTSRHMSNEFQAGVKD